MMKIFTVTTIEYIKESDSGSRLPEFGEICTHGYFNDLKSAILAVKTGLFNNKISVKNRDIKLLDKPAGYVIIEEYEEGIHPYSKNRWVFKYRDDKYVCIDEPILLNKVCNFAFR